MLKWGQQVQLLPCQPGRGGTVEKNMIKIYVSNYAHKI